MYEKEKGLGFRRGKTEEHQFSKSLSEHHARFFRTSCHVFEKLDHRKHTKGTYKYVHINVRTLAQSIELYSTLYSSPIHEAHRRSNTIARIILKTSSLLQVYLNATIAPSGD